MRLLKIGCICGSLAVSAGCGLFTDHSRDYQRATSIPPMVLPQGMQSQSLEPLYTIPVIANQEASFMELGNGSAPRPDPLGKNTEEAKVKIQKVSGKRWIQVGVSSSQIWPLTQSFLASRNMAIAKNQPSAGVIETHWLTLKNDTANRNRFRLVIETGLHPDTAEVHIVHQAAAPGQELATWPETTQNAHQEAALLDDLALALAEGINNRAASLLGQKVGGDVKAALSIQAGEPVLKLNLSLERAQASLSRSITVDGYVNWGQMPEAGLYYLGYKDQANPPGWFKRWFLLARAKAPAQPPKPLTTVIQHLSNVPEVVELFQTLPNVAFVSPKEGTPYVGWITGRSSSAKLRLKEGFLVRLVPAGNSYLVYIRNVHGHRLKPSEAKQQLTVLLRNLF